MYNNHAAIYNYCWCYANWKYIEEAGVDFLLKISYRCLIFCIVHAVSNMPATLRGGISPVSGKFYDLNSPPKESKNKTNDE